MIKIDRIPLPWSRARTLPPAASSGDLIVFAPSTSAGPEGGLSLHKGRGAGNQIAGFARELLISATGFVTGFGWPAPCMFDSTDLFATVCWCERTAGEEAAGQSGRPSAVGEEAAGRSGRRSAVGGVGGTDRDVGVGGGSLKILTGVLVHRVARPLRGSVSCGRSGWSVPCVCRFN